MTMESIVQKWLERAYYDLSAADSLLKSGHFLYVAFLCQQAIEKTLKALWCSLREDPPPYTHNLVVLSESLKLPLAGDQGPLLNRLNHYYIVGRYPSFKQKLASSLDKNTAVSLLTATKEFVAWCKKSIKM